VKGVGEIFVYGDSFESYLVGIAVPNEGFIELAKQNGIEGSMEELCQNEELKKLLYRNMREKGKEAGLYGFEQISKIYLEPVSFLKKGCMTNTFKI